MQIDLHHAGNYAFARIAGFNHQDASTIAYAAQYVDDATHAGLIQFDEGSAYQRQSSAHKALDYRNFQRLAHSRVWLPFHFLPGNGGLPQDQSPSGGRVAKLITTPDSPPARDMVRAAVAARDRPWALHRLGIAMHVYGDTWAHQGFCGINHEVNDASQLQSDDGEAVLTLREKLSGWFVGEALPLGHGAVLSFPDRPYLQWSYVNGLGQLITRNNPADFMEAGHRICQQLRRFREGDPDAIVPGLDGQDREVVKWLLGQTGEVKERHERWLRIIGEGHFSFGAADLDYIEMGPGSWKHSALGTNDDADLYPLSPTFSTSDWKQFHDALQEHRFDVLHRILPRYGILAD